MLCYFSEMDFACVKFYWYMPWKSSWFLFLMVLRCFFKHFLFFNFWIISRVFFVLKWTFSNSFITSKSCISCCYQSDCLKAMLFSFLEYWVEESKRSSTSPGKEGSINSPIRKILRLDYSGTRFHFWCMSQLGHLLCPLNFVGLIILIHTCCTLELFMIQQNLAVSMLYKWIIMDHLVSF